MRSSEKLRIRREAAKRMMHKNMDPDYIKEITGLSRKQIKHVHRLNESFIGATDMYFRKKFAREHQLYHGYYIERRTRFYTGVDIDKSDFYLNRYIQKSGDWKFKEMIDEVPVCYEYMMRLESLQTIFKYLKFDEKYLEVLNISHELNYPGLERYDVYTYITRKIRNYVQELHVLNLLSVEGNLKRVAFISNIPDERIERVLEKNSMFCSNGKIDMKRIEDKCRIWKRELEVEIAKRSTDGWPAVENNVKLLGLDKYKLEEIFNSYHSQEGEEFEFRKGIVERLMADAHSIQDISEISGIAQFYVDLNVDDAYYSRYFSRYYDRYANEELIKYSI